MEIKLIKTEKNVASVEALVSKIEVEAQKDHAIDELGSKITVKGFRQGKAPKKVAEQYLSSEKVSNHILNHLLSEIVNKSIIDLRFNLLGRPVLESLDTQKDDGWVIKLDFPLMPVVDVKDYKKYAKTKPAKTTTKKTVKKEEQEKSAKPETAKDKENEKISQIYQSLLKNIEIDIPQSVIDEEVNYSLERLASQAQSLNLSLESYLKAVNRTMDQIKEEYQKGALESLKLDLILTEIAKKEGIGATDEEISKFASVANLPENQKVRLRTLIERRKTIEFLTSL